MRQKRKIGLATYILFDFLAAVLAWAALFLFRKVYIEGNTLEDAFSAYSDNKFYFGVTIIPVCWLVLYFVAGSYTDIYRKSRLSEFTKTVLLSLFGVTIIFFGLLLNDFIGDYRDYNRIYFFLLGIHIFLTTFTRTTILTLAKRQLSKGTFGYNTLMLSLIHI